MTQTKAAQGSPGAASAGVGSSAAGSAPLLFSLDRGAVEIRMNGLVNDSIMTPDLRMTVRANGPLDVRLRVARNGDTCVENRGGAAPVLAVSDPFGESMYEVMAGQHVLFEHGDLHEVVDHETEPCGCPDSKGATVAEALLAPGGQKLGAKTATPPTAVELHPFPAAVSEGLAPTAEVAKAEANPTEPQATSTLVYNGAVPGTDVDAGAGADAKGGRARGGVSAGATKSSTRKTAPTTVAAVPSASAAAPVPLQSAPPARKEPVKADESPNRDLVHAIGHFFRALFGH